VSLLESQPLAQFQKVKQHSHQVKELHAMPLVDVTPLDNHVVLSKLLELTLPPLKANVYPKMPVALWVELMELLSASNAGLQSLLEKPQPHQTLLTQLLL